MVIGECGVLTLFVPKIVEGHSQELGYVTTLNLKMVAYSVHYHMEVVIEVEQISVNEPVTPKPVQVSWNKFIYIKNNFLFMISH